MTESLANNKSQPVEIKIETLIPRLNEELKIPSKQIQSVLELLLADNTIPFIARYRKEATGNLDEVQITSISDRYAYLKDMEERRIVILESIRSQEKLTVELEKSIKAASTKQQLEDLYLPYKPKRRTRATIAQEKGLAPLAELLRQPDTGLSDINAWITSFNQDKDEPVSKDDALKGARDIIAEQISEDAETRQSLRQLTQDQGLLTTKAKQEYAEKASKFEMYYEFEEKISTLPPHRTLAIRRGEKEGVLRVGISLPEESVEANLETRWLKEVSSELLAHWKLILKDTYQRLLAPAIETDIRMELKLAADESSIDMFSKNLRQLLLQPPAGARIVLGLDPGFRTGTKWVVIDQTGRYLENGVIYPVPPQNKIAEAKKTIRQLVNKYGIDTIAIGNGTASREVQQFTGNCVKEDQLKVTVLLVNESGASIYSASEVAREEFPDLDLTVRGAISIARRYQDPLAELVKIDPKSIGVGQYQHDVNQTRLKQTLDRTVESCVNYVGVDLNRASAPLLSYVSGISKPLAQRIVEHRNTNGAFGSRQDILAVKGLGQKTFEQAAGFLRLPEGKQILDRSAVHPENYGLVEQMANDQEVTIENLIGNQSVISKIKTGNYQSETIGEYTIQDILEELSKPGRDPRDDQKTVEFDESVQDIGDLKVGMKLQGVITNVTHFGAFVDIGVHQDGLVHISQLADRYVKDPMEVCSVGQQVKATVTQVDVERKRIGLSLKTNPDDSADFSSGKSKESPQKNRQHTGKKGKQRKNPNSSDSVKTTGNFQDDLASLMKKFNQH